MSVVGFDIGNLNCYIGIARQGGIEVITNDYSLHATPSCVSFGPKSRSMGVAARQSVNTNFKNTIINFKQMIGRKFSDAVTQKFIPFVPCEVIQTANDEIGFKVSYRDKQSIFTPEQILAALLTKLKDIIESQLKDVKKVTDCVVTVPSYFTDVQRRATQAAIQFAGLNALRVMNESTAIALAYGIYKQDLPEESAKPRHVVFLDVGHTSTQASLVAFNKGKLQMLGSTHDLDIGGLWLDDLLREHFREMFKKNFGVDAKESPRAWLRLLDECERLKKQMSANQTPIPISIECFLHDKDVSGKMQRSEFEDLAAPLFEKIRNLLIRLLNEAGIQKENVDEIEMIGGSSRIPAIRRIVHEVFGKDPKTTMNLDEAVARGAAMQCAILSPAFRVREFSIKDSQPYRIKIIWSGGASESGESDVFVEHDEFPYSKMVSLYRSDSFQVDARYALPNTVPHTTSVIGSWRIAGVTPASDGQPRKVKVKVRLNPNGVFAVCSATMYDTQIVEEVQEEQAMEQDSTEQTLSTEQPSSTNAQTDPNAANSNAPIGTTNAPAASNAQTPSAQPKPKTKTISTELTVEECLPVVYDIKKYADIEVSMQKVDLHEKQKADAKNTVEEYVYEMRDKISDCLAEFVTEEDADAFRSQLTTTEDWLYDEGEDAEKPAYEQRLGELRKFGDPIVERYREAQARKPAFDAFDTAIIRARKAYDDYVAGGEAHAHIDSADMEKVINAIEEKKRWLDEARHKQERKSKAEPPAVFAHEITQKQQAFEAVVMPILTRKKPAPPPQKKEQKQKQTESPATNQAGDNATNSQQPAEMEVD
ncbi:DnaK family protein [Dictyocaulus viviparus]|uniref:DnaK family protein n=1 Tax=Dictyocaulus viviparus TaxID=29172 RepID=A0A0D8Y6Z2_DICVI|nr:DnaK family protein [Dictyocaulus viviparus]